MPWIRFFFWFLWQWCPYNLWTNFRNSVHSVFTKLVYNKEKFLQIQMMIYSHISWENAMVLLLQMPDDNWFYCYLNGKRAITKVIYLKYYNKICLGFSLSLRSSKSHRNLRSTGIVVRLAYPHYYVLFGFIIYSMQELFYIFQFAQIGLNLHIFHFSLSGI